LPSLNEGLSIAALEAMALGRPVVASRVGGIPEVVAEGETGLLVEPGQIAPLATAIATLAADPARRESMGAAGRRRARECFDGERMTAEIEAIYAAQTERWRRRQGR
jgi:glycosyltransferase involved in cell wall biosynthesis